MCTISVIGLDIIGTFKGNNIHAYIYIICHFNVQISNENTLFTFLEKTNIEVQKLFLKSIIMIKGAAFKKYKINRLLPKRNNIK